MAEPTSPTPAETAAARAAEAAEQATLPYTWTQTIGDLAVTVPIPATLKARDLAVTLTKTSLSVAIKGQDPLITVWMALPRRSPILCQY